MTKIDTDSDSQIKTVDKSLTTIIYTYITFQSNRKQPRQFDIRSENDTVARTAHTSRVCTVATWPSKEPQEYQRCHIAVSHHLSNHERHNLLSVLKTFPSTFAHSSLKATRKLGMRQGGPSARSSKEQMDVPNTRSFCHELVCNRDSALGQPKHTHIDNAMQSMVCAQVSTCVHGQPHSELAMISQNTPVVRQKAQRECVALSLPPWRTGRWSARRSACSTDGPRKLLLEVVTKRVWCSWSIWQDRCVCFTQSCRG